MACRLRRVRKKENEVNRNILLVICTILLGAQSVWTCSLRVLTHLLGEVQEHAPVYEDDYVIFDVLGTTGFGGILEEYHYVESVYDAVPVLVLADGVPVETEVQGFGLNRNPPIGENMAEFRETQDGHRQKITMNKNIMGIRPVGGWVPDVFYEVRPNLEYYRGVPAENDRVSDDLGSSLRVWQGLSNTVRLDRSAKDSQIIYEDDVYLSFTMGTNGMRPERSIKAIPLKQLVTNSSREPCDSLLGTSLGGRFGLDCRVEDLVDEFDGFVVIAPLRPEGENDYLFTPEETDESFERYAFTLEEVLNKEIRFDRPDRPYPESLGGYIELDGGRHGHYPMYEFNTHFVSRNGQATEPYLMNVLQSSYPDNVIVGSRRNIDRSCGYEIISSDDVSDTNNGTKALRRDGDKQASDNTAMNTENGVQEVKLFESENGCQSTGFGGGWALLLFFWICRRQYKHVLLIMAIVSSFVACDKDNQSVNSPEHISSESKSQLGEQGDDENQEVELCENGVLDEGETEVDCGGECEPCGDIISARDFRALIIQVCQQWNTCDLEMGCGEFAIPEEVCLSYLGRRGQSQQYVEELNEMLRETCPFFQERSCDMERGPHPYYSQLACECPIEETAEPTVCTGSQYCQDFFNVQDVEVGVCAEDGRSIPSTTPDCETTSDCQDLLQCVSGRCLGICAGYEVPEGIERCPDGMLCLDAQPGTLGFCYLDEERTPPDGTVFVVAMLHRCPEGTVMSGSSRFSGNCLQQCVEDGLPSCDDGRQNGSETAIDCGGDCGPCPTCGDGEQERLEYCDDGNLIDGDGCSSTCHEENDSCETPYLWEAVAGTTVNYEFDSNVGEPGIRGGSARYISFRSSETLQMTLQYVNADVSVVYDKTENNCGSQGGLHIRQDSDGVFELPANTPYTFGFKRDELNRHRVAVEISFEAVQQ